MAGVKITDLTALSTPDSADYLCIVDVSDTSQSPDGTTKKIEVGNIVNLQEAYDNGPGINSFTIEFNLTNRKTLIGYNSSTGDDSVALGVNASAGGAGDKTTAIGAYAAEQNTEDNVTAIGYFAGYQQSGANLTSIGFYAGNSNIGDDVTAIGGSAAAYNEGNNLVAIGNGAGGNNEGDNVVAIGTGAADSNTLNGMFVIAPTHLPSYADATAAAAAITVALGAHTGDYYLYHDQSDGGIKAIIP